MTRTHAPTDTTPPVYDRLADRYDAAMRPLERWFLARLRAAALGELPAGARVIEVGAGTGLNFRHYAPETRGAALELSFEMLRHARRKETRPPAVALVQGRAERLPFADDAFDAALVTLVLCSVARPEAALQELRRVVRTGGRVVLLEHVRPDGLLLGPLFDLFNVCTSRLFEDHVNRRTAHTAAAAGLRVQRVARHLFGVVQLIVCEVC
jgi:ubiquinone/menaquinone biosynthesis C-methylase UbiE